MIMTSQSIFLPGGFKQFRILRDISSIKGRMVLIIGAGTEKIAEKFFAAEASDVKIITDDFESLMSAKLNLGNRDKVEIKLMDYASTDFAENEFDLVYAQGSISSPKRNKIIKEIKRILKLNGILCVGEISVLSEAFPIFVRDIFESSDIAPLLHSKVENYYAERGFEVIYMQDLSSSLKSFYERAAQELKQKINDLSGQEKSYYKKLLNKISHESNAYLNLGADRYIGFKMLILKLSGSAS